MMIEVAALVLAAVFLVGAVAKVADLKRTHDAAVALGVPVQAARAVVWLLIAVELTIAAALPIDRPRLVGAAGALALLGIVTVVATINVVRGRTPECACFGSLTRSRIGWFTPARNALLASIAAYVAAGGREPGVFIGLALASCGAWAILGPLRTWRRGSPPNFELDGQLGKSWSLDRLVDGGRPVLLVFSQPSCGACHALLPDLEEWHRRLENRLNVAVVNQGVGPTPTAAYPVLTDAAGSVASAYGVTATPSAVLIEPRGRTVSAIARGYDEIGELVRSRFAPDEPRFPRRAVIVSAARGVATLGAFPLVAAACGSSSSTTTRRGATTSSTRSLKVGDAYICRQKYALCTNAACEPSAHDPDVVVCDCVVKSGYSVGLIPCPQRAPHGSTLYSEFSTELVTGDVRAMTCPAHVPWANCVDSPCELDPNDPGKARCQCPVVKMGPSFTFGGDCNTNTCGKTVWSGAHTTLGGAKVAAAMKRLGQPLVTPKPCPTS